MTRPLRRWDPFRPLDMLASLWSTAAVAPVSTGAAAAYRTLFMTLRRLVVGRELSVRLDEGDITLTVTEFDSRLDVRGLAVGQLSDVRLAARDIRWDKNRLDRATAVLHNVYLRPSAPPVLIAAPVDLTVELPADALDDLFRLAAPRLTGEIGEDGVARLRLARRPAFGHLEVDALLDGSTLWLKPRGLVVRSKRMRLSNRTPAYPVHLPELPHGLQLTDISIEPDKLCLSGTLQEWRVDVPRTRLEDVINQLNVVGRPLNLTRFGRG
ncbi:MAG: LmeA family phospholipid-binding protein [Mycobacterium sp.]